SLLDFLDLLQPGRVRLTALEARVQEGAHQVDGQCRADDLRAQAENVHVVVLDPLVRRVDVVAHGAADSVQLGYRNGSADTGAADEDSALGVSVLDQLSELSRLVGIVDPDGGGFDAEVERLVTERIEL